MAETHAGITNENSFFSDHYLSDLFAKDRQRWEKDTDAELAGSADRRRLANLYLQGKRAYGAGMERAVLPASSGGVPTGPARGPGLRAASGTSAGRH